MVLSNELDTIRLPSVEIAIDETVSVCPLRSAPDVSPVTLFHTRISPDCEPETMSFVSGEIATEVT